VDRAVSVSATTGSAGVHALLRRILELARDGRWYLFAAGYMAAVKFMVVLLHRVITGNWAPFGYEAVYLILPAILISTPVQAGEEIGWRGYALPRLSSVLGLPMASIVLGVIWACWHLPIFFMPGSDSYGQSFPVYLLSVTALSVAMAWLYWRTNESLFLVMLMHAAINNTRGSVPWAGAAGTTPFRLDASLLGWLTAGVLWIPAVYFLARMRSSRLTSGLGGPPATPVAAK
jgi:membrane protease YdiL (CAAX protease family)